MTMPRALAARLERARAIVYGEPGPAPPPVLSLAHGWCPVHQVQGREDGACFANGADGMYCATDY